MGREDHHLCSLATFHYHCFEIIYVIKENYKPKIFFPPPQKNPKKLNKIKLKQRFNKEGFQNKMTKV